MTRVLLIREERIREERMFLIILAGIMLVLFAVVWLWQNPGLIRGRLRAPEIAQLMGQIDKLPFPEEHRPVVLKRLRAWMESDDGKPFYMLNLMRYYAELRRFPNAPEFRGTPQESNARYEAATRSMLLTIGGYPLYAGTPHGKNILEHDPALDDWSRLLLVRYPSRRAFLRLVTHPAYREVEPYKVMALQVILTPTTPERVVPSVPLLVGGALLVVFLAVGWAHAAGVF
jgi:hypothetical protein